MGAFITHTKRGKIFCTPLFSGGQNYVSVTPPKYLGNVLLSSPFVYFTQSLSQVFHLFNYGFHQKSPNRPISPTVTSYHTANLIIKVKTMVSAFLFKILCVLQLKK